MRLRNARADQTDLSLALVLSAYLREPSDSEQAMHGSGALVSVHGTQLGKAQRQVSVAVLLVLVHSNVEGAVHGAQLIHLLLHLRFSLNMINPQ